jgi:hypothetical protein
MIKDNGLSRSCVGRLDEVAAFQGLQAIIKQVYVKQL